MSKAEEELQKIRSALHLENDEKIELYWWGAMFFRPQKQIKGDFMMFDMDGKRGRRYREEIHAGWHEAESGDFVITNKRIIWLKSSGLLHKSLIAQFAIKHDEVMGINIEGTLNKKLIITTDKGIYGFYMKNMEDARNLIQNKNRLIPELQ